MIVGADSGGPGAADDDRNRSGDTHSEAIARSIRPNGRVRSVVATLS
jgi:hypothetical protein